MHIRVAALQEYVNTCSIRRILILDHLGLYTILPSPKVYGVWHTKGGGRLGGVHSAMVVQ